MRAVQLRIEERVMVVRDNGDVQRGTVRAEAHAQGERYYFIDLIGPTFSSVIVYETEERQTWCRGWHTEEEARAIFAAEALK